MGKKQPPRWFDIMEGKDIKRSTVRKIPNTTTNMMDNMGQKQGMTCTCSHHKMVPILIILIALAFLLQAANVLTAAFVSLAWPALLGLIGVVKLTKGMCKCC